ncbi:hypothetical protein [Caballeronia grimmiae]|uniref:hypothetical protein n=1 Tax=Caballeronia grimmiae TaxID=1071679 RepID=UPI0038B7C0C1
MSCVIRGIVIVMLVATGSTAFAQQWGGHQRRDHEPKLYDANGKFVGVVVDAPMGDGSDGGVLMDVNGAAVMVGFALEKGADGSQSATRLI